MIKSFKCKETEKVFNGEKTRKLPSDIIKTAKRKLDMLHFAHAEIDLMVPPSNRFEHLKGVLYGYCSIRINDQFRIVFKFQDGNVEDVKIMDYH
jgi:toxin HigB-1